MFEELKDYIASHTKEEIQEDWKETPEFESGMAVELYQNSEALQQLPEKSLNAFNRILDSICEEEKNDSKDESR